MNDETRSPVPMTPFEFFKRLEQWAKRLKEQQISGVLTGCVMERGGYSFRLIPKDDCLDSEQIATASLRLFTLDKKLGEKLKENAWRDVTVQGQINLWPLTVTSGANVSIYVKQLVEIRGLYEDTNSTAIEEQLKTEFVASQKTRGQKLRQKLIAQVENAVPLKVVVVSPKQGRGATDIFNKYHRAINEEVDKYGASKIARNLEMMQEELSLTRSSNDKKAIQSHFDQLAKEIRNINEDKDESGMPAVDLICLARGGGPEEELKRLNNRALCEAVIHSNVPVCTALGHDADQSYLWLSKFSDLAYVSPTEFVDDMLRIVNTAYWNNYRKEEIQKWKNDYAELWQELTTERKNASKKLMGSRQDLERLQAALPKRMVTGFVIGALAGLIAGLLLA